MLTKHASARAAAASLLLPLSALLAGCDGPSHPSPPLKVELAGADASGISMQGDDVVFTFSVTNTSGSDIPDTAITFAGDSVFSGVAPPLRTTAIACSAQGGTCPAIHGAFVDQATLAAGSVLTFTVTANVAGNYGGQAAMDFFLYSTARAGSAKVLAHATLQDSRDAQYETFSTSGRRTSALVTFTDGAAKFLDLAGDTPVAFTSDAVGYLFADGSHFVTLPDMLLGRHDFGAGPETFVAGRFIDASPGDLDGKTFALFTADATGGGMPATAVRAATVSGSTLTICMDAAPQTADTCPAGSQWHYALTLDGAVYTATDSQHGDTIVLQALVSSHTLYLLRAEQAGGARHFAIGVPDGAPSADLQQFVGDIAGHWSLLQLSPSGYVTTASVGQAGFGPLGASAALQPVANGPAALQQVVRASDGATVLVAGSKVIAVQLGTPGELDLLGNTFAP